jgi:hypothetical protein
MHKKMSMSMLLRTGFASLAVLVTAASPAIAAPWAEPGDAGLRSDIETLKTFGLISGPITTWPLPWKQILRDLDNDVGDTLPAFVSEALARVREKAPKDEDTGSLKFGAAMQATNKASLVRSFDDTARQPRQPGRQLSGPGTGRLDGLRRPGRPLVRPRS